MSQRSTMVIVGLSGGVDSAVSAYLLRRAGYSVRAVFMVNWREGGSCHWEDDFVSARSVAKHLAIPLEIWDFAKEYREYVFNDFLALYRKGLTPNPDVFCNKYIKFGAFYDRARREGADFVATGHYAHIRQQTTDRGQYSFLYSANDTTKDQSDFLYQIRQSHLKHILFPIGGMLKSEVKALAREIGLPNWNRPESMGVCFIGEMNMKKFLQKYLPPSQGDIVDIHNNVLGKHEGAWYYTIGQREGLNIGGRGPYFIVRKDMERNRLIVAREPEARQLLLVRSVVLSRTNFLSPRFRLPTAGFSLPILWRDRHLSPLERGRVKRENGRWIVEFSAPKRAVAPGQSLVLYDLKGEQVMGGGMIVKTES